MNERDRETLLRSGSVSGTGRLSAFVAPAAGEFDVVYELRVELLGTASAEQCRASVTCMKPLQGSAGCIPAGLYQLRTEYGSSLVQKGQGGGWELVQVIRHGGDGIVTYQ
ncbi:MAG: hypothetical protein JO166_22270 [Deltaproteobacteria bacterium]|nr:hypothetical protein [Deltaproteobacteria bacterium]